MKSLVRSIVLSAVLIAGIASVGRAQENETEKMQAFRTTAFLQLLYQGTNKVGALQTDRTVIWGHDLVNIALGTSLSTPRTNEVLVMDIADDSRLLNLVVYDKIHSNNIALLATSTPPEPGTAPRIPIRSGVEKVVDQLATNKWYIERFVAQMQFESVNALAGGELMVSGRLHLTASNGIPASVSTDDDTALDSRYCDSIVANNDDKDRNTSIAGEAHFIGTLKVLCDGGAATNTYLIPIGHMTIRHTVPMAQAW